MVHKLLRAFPRIPGVCGATFSSPAGCFALPFAAAASCCAISLWVRSLRRLKHSLDIAVQLCGCPPSNMQTKRKCSTYVQPSCSLLYPFWQCPCGLSISFKNYSTTSFLKIHTVYLHCDSLFVLWGRWKHGQILSSCQWITLKRTC